MNNRTVAIISGLIGSVIGAGATFLVTSKYYKNKSSMEINAYKAYISKKTSNANQEHEPMYNIKDPTPEKKDPPVEVNEKWDSIKKEYESIIAKHYKISDQDSISSEEDTMDQIIKEDQDKLDSIPDITIISSDTFSGDDPENYRDDFDHVYLDYFEGDDQVAILGETTIMDNVSRILGVDWRNHFGDPDFGFDEDQVCVRNKIMKTDYEICRDKGSFAQIRLGINEED